MSSSSQRTTCFSRGASPSCFSSSFLILLYSDFFQSMRSLESKADAARTALTVLLEEEQCVLAKLEKIQAELKLVKTHVSEQERKVLYLFK